MVCDARGNPYCKAGNTFSTLLAFPITIFYPDGNTVSIYVDALLFGPGACFLRPPQTSLAHFASVRKNDGTGKLVGLKGVPDSRCFQEPERLG